MMHYPSHPLSGRTRRAFTLIELLVTVAIIAILAAIGIANMLQSQMRAKVARTRADMRTIATALEAYGTDNGAYPSSNGFGLAMSRPSIPGDKPVLERLSTPVAYLTAIPSTPFPPTRISAGLIDGISLPNTNISQWPQINRKGPDGHLYELYQYTSAAASENTISGIERVTNDDDRKATVYIIQCAGPLLGQINLGGVISNSTHADAYDLFYDPTNGTRSFGNLFRATGSAPNNDNFLSATISQGAAN